MNDKKINEFISFADSVYKNLSDNAEKIHNLVLERLKELAGTPSEKHPKFLDIKKWSDIHNAGPFLTAFDSVGPCGKGHIIAFALVKRNGNLQYSCEITGLHPTVSSYEISTINEIEILRLLETISNDQEWHFVNNVLVKKGEEDLKEFDVTCSLRYIGCTNVKAKTEEEAIETVKKAFMQNTLNDFREYKTFGNVEFEFAEATVDYANEV